MIFNGIKRRWLRKEIQKLRKNQERPPIKWPQSLVVIYDGQQPVDTALFYHWAKELQIKKEAVSFIAYVNDIKKSTIEDALLVDRKLIKWSGGVSDASFKKLMNKSHDLQINYYDKKNDLLEYISLVLPSGFKVAYGDSDESLYDLSIGVKLKDYEAFLTELKKYLKILTQ